MKKILVLIMLFMSNLTALGMNRDGGNNDVKKSKSAAFSRAMVRDDQDEMSELIHYTEKGHMVCALTMCDEFRSNAEVYNKYMSIAKFLLKNTELINGDILNMAITFCVSEIVEELIIKNFETQSISPLEIMQMIRLAKTKKTELKGQIRKDISKLYTFKCTDKASVDSANIKIIRHVVKQYQKKLQKIKHLKKIATMLPFASRDKVAISYAMRKSLECFNAVMIDRKIDINVTIGHYPLIMEAVMQHNFDIVKYLLQRGADVNRCDEGGYTALMLASQDKASAIVKLLLAAGADVDITDSDGKTALHYALQKNDNTEIIDALIWSSI